MKAKAFLEKLNTFLDESEEKAELEELELVFVTPENIYWKLDDIKIIEDKMAFILIEGE